MNNHEGWKLVPEEPTEDMLAATSWPGCARADYLHMLAAAPTPPVATLRLPEPMTGEEMYASDELMRLNGRKLGLSLNELAEVVGAIEAEVLRRVKEANNG